MTRAELSRQIEWFHQFAKQPIDQLALQATAENRVLFEQFVIASLPNHRPPLGQSAREFADAVVKLRDNERQWNQGLMSAMVAADDLYQSQDRQGAVATLAKFAESCPWHLFHEAALNQADNYRDR